MGAWLRISEVVLRKDKTKEKSNNNKKHKQINKLTENQKNRIKKT